MNKAQCGGQCGLRDGGAPQATIFLRGTQNSGWLGRLVPDFNALTRLGLDYVLRHNPSQKHCFPRLIKRNVNKFAGSEDIKRKRKIIQYFLSIRSSFPFLFLFFFFYMTVNMYSP